MRQLSRVQNAIFLVGGLLMVIGAGLSLFRFAVAPYIYALGAIGFASMPMLQRYDGQNFVIRRLRRIMVLSDVLFLFTAVLMFANQGNALGLDWIYYLNYIKNNWLVLLLLAAILQLYTTYRIDHELEKEAKKQ
jgi:hypothetical protein